MSSPDCGLCLLESRHLSRGPGSPPAVTNKGGVTDRYPAVVFLSDTLRYYTKNSGTEKKHPPEKERKKDRLDDKRKKERAERTNLEDDKTPHSRCRPGRKVSYKRCDTVDSRHSEFEPQYEMLLGFVSHLVLGLVLIGGTLAQRSSQSSNSQNSVRFSFNSNSNNENNNNNNNDYDGGNYGGGNYGGGNYYPIGNNYDPGSYTAPNYNDQGYDGGQGYGSGGYDPGYHTYNPNYYNQGTMNQNHNYDNSRNGYNSGVASGDMGGGRGYSQNEERGRPIIASVTFSTAPNGPPQFPPPRRPRPPFPRFPPPPPYGPPFPPPPSQIVPVPVPMPMPVPMPIPHPTSTTTTSTTTTTTTPPPESTTTPQTTTTPPPPSTPPPDNKQPITHISIIAPPTYLQPLPPVPSISCGGPLTSSYDSPCSTSYYSCCPCSCQNSCNSPYYL
ncbi:hypothetical protein RUM43_008971 [Polyplax serrata]|uniref:Uncharacterized protein n=1 Tax=Polyplax serrata TaxID=468196 RepID=A0AAN8RU38_POLSC